ncbi:MAG: nucleotide sugar dehydrogenase [Chloroflexota bacterium]|nr:nucleotide sugar dehydrogenase [Chloroflexota bacterium]
MSLKQRILNRSARVAVKGVGYVGLPLAVAFAKAGFPVVGIDVDEEKVEAINAGSSYIEDVPSEQLARLVSAEDKGLRATTDNSVLDQCDVAIICVPTPLSKTRDPDISCILDAASEVADHLHPEMLVVLESTTYPGTTEELLLPRLAENGLQVGKDFYLAFSPERIDPGRTDRGLENTPKVLGGVTPQCLTMAQALYEQVIEEVVPVSSTQTAEMVKLLENTFRAVNIALVNEVAIMCGKLGLDVWEVIEAASTKPYGFMTFYPGPGLGGHCIPIDPHYLAWKLKTVNYNARFIQLASEINAAMPHYVMDKVFEALNEEGKAVKGSRILLLGVAYKRDVSDIRESPALDILRLLKAKGAMVSYHDPHVPHLRLDDIAMDSVTLDADALASADCVVVVTDHSDYDWDWIAGNSRLLVDTRNATAGVGECSAHIVKL